MLKDSVKLILRLMAVSILKKYRPKIVAVTGSVGKTATKEAIALVLSRKFSLWKSVGNYNNEIGMPLTILGISVWEKSVVLPLLVFGRFLKLLIGNSYPKILVLEMGADKIGDLAYLTKIAPPAIAVVTRVGEAHMEFFGDIETVQKEKSQLVSALSFEGLAVLNFDDPKVLAMKNQCKGKVLTYGLGEGADIRATDIQIVQSLRFESSADTLDLGTSFEIVTKEEAATVYISGLLGLPPVYSLLAACSVGRVLNISLSEIIKALKRFVSPPGRLRHLAGIKRTIILDDTYNSSPEAAVESLKVLKQIRARRRIAVLGDMLELGPNTESSHRRIGRLVRDLGIEMLFTVGERAKFIADEAAAQGFAKSRIFEFDSSDEAALPLQNKMQEGDVVLIKGSRGMAMEKITEEVMAEPEKADELLYRQH